MAIQMNLVDRFKVTHPQAYAVIAKGEWKLGAGGFAIGVDIYASKAAKDAGGEPIHSFEKFVAFDSSGMTASIEQAIMLDPLIASGTPTQVA